MKLDGWLDRVAGRKRNERAAGRGKDESLQMWRDFFDKDDPSCSAIVVVQRVRAGQLQTGRYQLCVLRPLICL